MKNTKENKRTGQCIKKPHTQEEPESLGIMQLCPKFLQCSAPICPLDSLQDERTYLKGEPKCTLSKAKRVKIGTEAGLERKGMTKPEWAASLRWEAQTEAEKARKLANLRPGSPNHAGDFEYVPNSRGRDAPSSEGPGKIDENDDRESLALKSEVAA